MSYDDAMPSPVPDYVWEKIPGTDLYSCDGKGKYKKLGGAYLRVSELSDEEAHEMGKRMGNIVAISQPPRS